MRLYRCPVCLSPDDIKIAVTQMAVLFDGQLNYDDFQPVFDDKSLTSCDNCFYEGPLFAFKPDKVKERDADFDDD